MFSFHISSLVRKSENGILSPGIPNSLPSLKERPFLSLSSSLEKLFKELTPCLPSELRRLRKSDEASLFDRTDRSYVTSANNLRSSSHLSIRRSSDRSLSSPFQLLPNMDGPATATRSQVSRAFLNPTSISRSEMI